MAEGHTLIYDLYDQGDTLVYCLYDQGDTLVYVLYDQGDTLVYGLYDWGGGGAWFFLANCRLSPNQLDLMVYI